MPFQIPPFPRVYYQPEPDWALFPSNQEPVKDNFESGEREGDNVAYVTFPTSFFPPKEGERMERGMVPK